MRGWFGSDAEGGESFEANAADRAARDERGGRDEVEERAARGGRGSHAERGARRPLGDVDEVLPGRITALQERKAGSARYVVLIDGRAVATVSATLIAELGLKIGAVVDEGLAARLRDEASRLAVFDKAVALLAARARSSRDLRLRLRRAGAGDEAVTWAIERLESLGYLDDAAFARNLARSRIVGGGMSKRRIGAELQRRGVSRPLADAAISDTMDEVELDEYGAARAAAIKRLRALRSYEPALRKSRLYAFLARRGYAPDVVARVVREVIGLGDGAGGEGAEFDDDGSGA